MVAERVEEAVRVGDDARRGESHHVAQARSWGPDWQPGDQRVVHIGVRRRDVLDVSGRAFDCHLVTDAADCEWNVQAYRDGRSHREILRYGAEPISRNG